MERRTRNRRALAGYGCGSAERPALAPASLGECHTWIFPALARPILYLGADVGIDRTKPRSKPAKQTTKQTPKQTPEASPAIEAHFEEMIRWRFMILLEGSSFPEAPVQQLQRHGSRAFSVGGKQAPELWLGHDPCSHPQHKEQASVFSPRKGRSTEALGVVRTLGLDKSPRAEEVREGAEGSQGRPPAKIKHGFRVCLASCIASKSSSGLQNPPPVMFSREEAKADGLDMDAVHRRRECQSACGRISSGDAPSGHGSSQLPNAPRVADCCRGARTNRFVAA